MEFVGVLTSDSEIAATIAKGSTGTYTLQCAHDPDERTKAAKKSGNMIQYRSSSRRQLGWFDKSFMQTKFGVCVCEYIIMNE